MLKLNVFKKGERQRLRPLTSGQSRPPMTYYRPKRAEAVQPALRRRLTFRAIKKFLRYLTNRLLLLLILALVIFSLILNPRPDVKVDNLAYRPMSDYISAATSELQVFFNRNKVTFNEAGFVLDISKKLPEVQSVKLNLPIYSRTARVNLQIAPPSFFLSGSSANAKRYIVADNGRAVALAENLPQITKLPLIKDQSNLPIKIGELVLGKGTSDFIISVLHQCQAAKVPVESFNLPIKSEEIDLKTTDRPYIVRFFVGGDPALQVGRFLAARAEFDRTGTSPQQYLDVRIDGRIYYQ